MCEVTKQEFENAYRKFPLSKIEQHFVKYVSIHSLKENKLTAVLVSLLFFAPLFFEILVITHHWPLAAKLIPSYIFMATLATVGIYWLRLWYKKKKRLEKIRKFLNISKEEYKELIDIYFYHRYPCMEDYIKFNATKK